MTRLDYKGGQILTDNITGLKKKRFSLAAIIFFIYCSTAGGAFGIEEMISSSGPGLTLLLLVLIPILWANPIGLYSAELTNLAPVDSGPYVWPKLAFGEFWGFAFGWWLIINLYLTGPAYVVLAVDYFGLYVSLTPTMAFILKAGMIIVFTVVNLKGLEGVSRLSNIFCVIVLVAFASVAFVGLTHWENNPFEPFMATGSEGAITSWGTGIAIGIWMYCGYFFVSFLGGEMENPEILPKGMKIAIIVIALSYILPTLGGIVSTGPWEEWGSTIDYSTVLTRHVGIGAGIAFMAAAVIAQFAIFNASLTTASRSFVILAKDNLCPGFLSKLTKKSRVPLWPIILLAVLNLILVNLDFEAIVSIMSPIIFILYMGIGIVFVKLRKDCPVEKRKGLYYVRGGKLGVIYVCGGPLLFGTLGLMTIGTQYFLLGFLVIISAVVAYIIFKWMYKGRYKNDPEKYPINVKTKLAKGDVVRIGVFFLIFGLLALIGSFLLVWYEGANAANIYLETYKTGLLSNFAAMINITRWSGIGMMILGIAMYFVGKKVDPVE